MSLRTHNRRLAHVFSLATIAAIAACAGRVETIDENDAGPDGGKGDAAVDATPLDAAVDVAPNCTPVRASKDTGCGYTVLLPCGIDRADSGAVPYGLCDSICNSVDAGRNWGCGESPFPPFGGDSNHDAGTGKIYQVTCYTCVAGRRPTGFTETKSAASVRGWLEQMAGLEAASVTAFEHVGTDLRALDAPQTILHAVDCAQRDEVRHTKAMTALAAAQGANVNCPDIATHSPKSRVTIAVENAVEGCIRETFGALVAEWQSRHAEHAELRLAMRTIARDERKHAALSWTIDSWLSESLTEGERARVAEAMRAAVSVLKCDAYFDFGSEVARSLGLPNREETAALIATLETQLWSAQLAA